MNKSAYMKLSTVIILSVFIGFVLLGLGGPYRVYRAYNTDLAEPTPRMAPEKWEFVHVTYRVTYDPGYPTDERSEIAVTMTNAQGGTEQKRIRLGHESWTSWLIVPHGDYVYLSTQLLEGFGNTTCSIDLEDVPFRSSTSEGQYSVASCSGLVR
jgi:hypothetical protein